METISQLIDSATKYSHHIVRELCFGCIHQSPSQHERDICMISTDQERLELLIDTIYEKIKSQPESEFENMIALKLQQ